MGLAAYYVRYEYHSKRGFTDLSHAICLAHEQEFEPTQAIPSVDAEIVHSSTYWVRRRRVWNWVITSVPWVTWLM